MKAITWLALLVAGRYDDASSWVEEGTLEGPSAQLFRVAAASNALRGRLEKAQQVIATLAWARLLILQIASGFADQRTSPD
jgi:hypothetical protein